MQYLSKKVLVCETDGVVRALVSHILRQQGFQVDISDGAGVVQHLRDAVYDAMILDIQIDGVLDFLNASPRAASRIIVTTSRDIDELAVHSILRKPIEFRELVTATMLCANPR